jgi:hypothetical protein
MSSGTSRAARAAFHSPQNCRGRAIKNIPGIGKFMRKTIVLSGFLFAGLSALCATEGRLYALRIYGAPCSQVSGFAGFLQRTHFLPPGDCKVNPKGKCVPSACSIGDGKKSEKGKCADAGGGCVCMPSRRESSPDF